MYKNNSGLIVKTKLSKYINGLCLTKKLVCENRNFSYNKPLAIYEES